MTWQRRPCPSNPVQALSPCESATAGRPVRARANTTREQWFARRGSVNVRVLLATTASPDDRKTLACARSLARAGAWVAVGGDAFWGEAFYSRCVRRRVRYPHPRLGVSPFIDALKHHIERDRYDVMLPMNDYMTLAVAQHRDCLPPSAGIALPPTPSLELAADKARTLALAASLGIDTPLTREPESEDDLRQVADQIAYPCIVKLRRGAGAVGFRILADHAALLSAYRAPREPSDLVFDHDHLLIQEYVPGEIHDACVLFRLGEPRAGYTQRRVRTYPATGGVGTIVETTREPALLESANRLLAALNWHGPAQVEFKVNPETGRTCLMEINGRFWGTTDVAVHAGVDFPALVYRLILDGDVSPVFNHAVGLRFRYPFPFGLLAVAEGGSRWRTARDFFAPQREVHSDVKWNDPLPLLAEALYIGRRAWKRRSLRPGRSPRR
jgi:predicted ATP-grasp superfamily ATP-dependent carboligase